MNRKIIAAAALAAAALAGGADAAHASTASIEGNVLVLRAKAGERNLVRVAAHPSGALALSDIEVGRIDTRGSGCRPDPESSRLLCNRFQIGSIRAELGDADDSFVSEVDEPALVEAGPGDDIVAFTDVRVDPPFDFTEVPSRVDFSGGPGRDTATFDQVRQEGTPTPGVSVSKNDRPDDGRPIDTNNVRSDVEVIHGSPQDDFLAGGSGPDTFISGRGADTLAGKTGDDVFEMGALKDGQTRVVGGADRDTVSYAQRFKPVLVSPDDPAFRDGEAGELDSIEGAEVIEGGTVADNLVSAPNAPAGYRLIGGTGDDILGSGAGKDRLIGGPGADRMSSGAERDVIEARDLTRDVVVDCGTGGDDLAFLDLEDRHTGCDTPLRPNPFPVGVVGLSESARVRADGTVRITLRWRHPVAWRRLQEITLRVPGAGRLTVEPSTASARAGGRGVRLVPGSRLRRSGRAVSARVEVALPRRAKRVTVLITAVDTAGRRQTETRSIAIAAP